MADSSSSVTAAPKLTWAQSLRVYLEPASLRMLALGFSAGLPLLLVLGTLSFRLREAGIDRATISFLGWVALAYGFKWVWAPLVDRLPIPLLTRWLGRRRSWLLVAQLTIMGGLVGMAFYDPVEQGVETLAKLALLVAFASATQDIALDAFRIESATVERQAVLASNYQTGYRLAMICAGAGVLSLAAWAERTYAPAGPGYNNQGWTVGYLAMAAAMLVGVVTVLFSSEPVERNRDANGDAHDPVYERALEQVAGRGVALTGIAAFLVWVAFVVVSVAQAAKAGWIKPLQAATGGYLLALVVLLAAVLTAITFAGKSPRLRPAAGTAAQRGLARVQASFVAPFVDFFQRYRWHALLILALISIYRISDVVMGIMANPFYVDMQFSKEQVALVSGVFGIFFTLLGTFIGGVLALRIGVMRVLMLGAVLSALSNLLFAWLSTMPGVAQDVWQFSLFGNVFEIPRALTLVITADNLAGGIASAAFIAYLSSLTSISYSATQYALFSSIMLLLPKFIAGFSGTFVNHYGYDTFFVTTALLGLPVVLLVWLAGRVLPAAGGDQERA